MCWNMIKDCMQDIDHSIRRLQPGRMLRAHRCHHMYQQLQKHRRQQQREKDLQEIHRFRHISSLENAVKLYKIKINHRAFVQRHNTIRTRTVDTCLESSPILQNSQEIDRRALSTQGVVHRQEKQRFPKQGITRKRQTIVKKIFPSSQWLYDQVTLRSSTLNNQLATVVSHQHTKVVPFRQ